jgi:hypothetical protein
MRKKVSNRVVRKQNPVSKKKPTERKKEEMDRAQVWSIDVLLALVIFIAIILIFYTTINAKQNPKLKELQLEAGGLKSELEKHPDLNFINSEIINSTKMQNFTEKVEENYSAVKEQLGVRGDFCIFFEDEEGNLIPVAGKNGVQKNGIGKNSSEINITDEPCGRALPPP